MAKPLARCWCLRVGDSCVRAFSLRWLLIDCGSPPRPTSEHRFYGASQPFDSLATDNLRYLSSRQALEDLTYLHAHVTDTHSLPATTKWVCFGGSYSGALSAWFRTKYPQLVVGAVANSAPVLAQLDFTKYFDVVTNSLSDISAHGMQCIAAVKTAITSLQTAITSSVPSDRQAAATQFRSCSVPSTTLDLANFFSTVGGAFMGTVC